MDRLLPVVALSVLALAVPGAIVGFSMDDPMALATSAALIGIAFVARDVGRWRQGGVSPMTLYAFAGVLTAAANTVVILNQDTSQRFRYFLYAIDAHLPLAMMIDWIGLVLPIVGFQLMMRLPSGQAISAVAPKIRGTVPDSRLILFAMVAAAVGISAKTTNVLPSLGTLNSIIYFLPHLAAFTLARTGVMRSWPKAVWIGFAIAMLEATRALLFAYLRSDVISPIFAYAVGVFMGARSLRVARSIYMVPVYALAVVIVAYFAAFGEVRTRSSGGVERLEAVAEVRAQQVQLDEPPRHNLLARLSSVNQLTQVGRVVEEDGFLGGETLEYLAYAWIPRLLWPEKPTIAKGAWFALRIGQARIQNGRITNSVNMTVPGELYLNYGWSGLVLGMLGFGALFAVLWTAAGGMRDRQNLIGAAFGFYLLWVGLGGGADLQIVVTLIAMYVLFLGASIVFTFARPASSIGARPAGPARNRTA